MTAHDHLALRAAEGVRASAGPVDPDSWLTDLHERARRRRRGHQAAAALLAIAALLLSTWSFSGVANRSQAPEPAAPPPVLGGVVVDVPSGPDGPQGTWTAATVAQLQLDLIAQDEAALRASVEPARLQTISYRDGSWWVRFRGTVLACARYCTVHPGGLSEFVDARAPASQERLPAICGYAATTEVADRSLLECASVLPELGAGDPLIVGPPAGVVMLQTPQQVAQRVSDRIAGSEAELGTSVGPARVVEVRYLPPNSTVRNPFDVTIGPAYTGPSAAWQVRHVGTTIRCGTLQRTCSVFNAGLTLFGDDGTESSLVGNLVCQYSASDAVPAEYPDCTVVLPDSRPGRQ